MDNLGRRVFIQWVGLALALAALASPALAETNQAQHKLPTIGPLSTSSSAPASDKPPYMFFNAEEAAFIEAACERLIPADEVGPGANEACVPNYLDKQLGGGWGSGERLYRSGPWKKGTPMQGYQLPYTPAELFRTAIRAIHHELRKKPLRDAVRRAEQLSHGTGGRESGTRFFTGGEGGIRTLDGLLTPRKALRNQQLTDSQRVAVPCIPLVSPSLAVGLAVDGLPVVHQTLVQITAGGLYAEQEYVF
jgi:Gluconate 2-dehydrogenase subunit 3